MKKFACLLIVIALLAGCSKNNTSLESNILQYEAIYNDLLDNDQFISKSNFYDLEVVMNKEADENGNDVYRWSVIIDNPQIAMFDLQALAIVNNLQIDEDNWMPSFGIISDFNQNFLPNQVNTELGYLKGFILDGLVTVPIVSLRITVSWYNYSRTEQKRENYETTVEYTEPESE